MNYNCSAQFKGFFISKRGWFLMTISGLTRCKLHSFYYILDVNYFISSLEILHIFNYCHPNAFTSPRSIAPSLATQLCVYCLQSFNPSISVGAAHILLDMWPFQWSVEGNVVGFGILSQRQIQIRCYYDTRGILSEAVVRMMFILHFLKTFFFNSALSCLWSFAIFPHLFHSCCVSRKLVQVLIK